MPIPLVLIYTSASVALASGVTLYLARKRTSKRRVGRAIAKPTKPTGIKKWWVSFTHPTLAF